MRCLFAVSGRSLILFSFLSPLIVSGKVSPPFPLAVQCQNQDEANSVMQLQPLIAKLEVVHPPLDLIALAGSLAYSEEIEGLNIGDGITTFYAVYFGNRIGIFLDKYVFPSTYDISVANYILLNSRALANTAISGAKVQGMSKFSSFQEALYFMVSKGKKMLPIYGALAPPSVNGVRYLRSL